jgi:hypothetical protein
MRRLLLVVAFGLALACSPAPTLAQVYSSGPNPYRISGAAGLPNLYGTSWGVAGYGTIRTYSTFASPFGVGYGYGQGTTNGFGYPSYGFIPNKYGVGLWRAGLATPGYAYGSANGYNTFPYPYKPGGPRYAPPIGLYAPGFGAGGPSPYYKP